MRILAGTSGFSYAPWKGSFYPEKLPSKQMLAFYATQLPAVEINNSFYRMPKPADLTAWADQTPDTFRFVLKAPKRISHVQKLVESGSDVARLGEVAAALGPKLGPVLIQLPPFLRVDAPRLRAFLAVLREVAPRLSPAFEFRHASWFCEEVYAALSEAKAALCIADDEKLTTPMVATAPWGYLRLRQEGYDDQALASWWDQVQKQSWSEAYVFFKHEDAGVGPRLAKAFLGLAGSPTPAP
ncbi:MAG: DUF72 domain-containing protein [Deltaproteobacteria bacterium]|nr:DUF72 domain-containing protein [Deltaproteobacteria bacterium]